MPTHLRTVIESKRFAKELASLIDNPTRADEFVEAVKIALARDPRPAEAYCICDNPPLLFIPCSPCENIVLYYTYGLNDVTLLSIIDSSTL
jgi:hypothetical protein